MKIAIVTTNGITTAFRGWPERLQTRALAERGHDVRAYTYLGKQSWNSQTVEIIDNVKVRRVRRRDWLSLDLAWAMWRDGKPNVVHLHHLSNQLAFETALICKLRGVPVVMTPHGPFHDPYLVADRDRPFDQPPRYEQIIQTPTQLLKNLRQRFKPKRHLKNYLTHSPLTLADKLVVLSEHERGVLQKLGVPPQKIILIPNGLDPKWLEGFAPAPKPAGELRVLYLGQLKYRKGFDLLARAIPQVVAKLPQTRFIFATHSPIERPHLIELLEDSGVRGYVDLPEETNDAQKAALFLSSDLYVLPTRYEGFGIPLIEAMSAGCPVISSRIPVVDEIIHDGENGLLFEYDNPDSLAQIIICALENPTLCQQLAENGRYTVTKYYTPIITDQLEALYTELI